jgi:hypothetical protein
VQHEVRFHYQWAVLKDLLPTVVSNGVLHQGLPHLANRSNVHVGPPQLEFYQFKKSMFMTLEFSAAAYRFGHSTARRGCRLNDDIGPIAILPLADLPQDPALTGFDEFSRQRAVDWGRFIDLEARPFGSDDPHDPYNRKRLQLAGKVDTSLMDPLSQLPNLVASDPPRRLAERNLLRVWRMRLPSGQDVARVIGVPMLDGGHIKIGKFSGDPTDIVGSVDKVNPVLTGGCLSWTNILAETQQHDTVVKTTVTKARARGWPDRGRDDRGDHDRRQQLVSESEPVPEAAGEPDGQRKVRAARTRICRAPGLTFCAAYVARRERLGHVPAHQSLGTKE